MYSDIPRIGVGIGWRREIAEEILRHKENIDWCEIIAEHYINVTPDKLDQLSTLARTFPVVPHGIDLSIGTDQPIEPEYFDSLSTLVKRVDGGPAYAIAVLRGNSRNRGPQDQANQRDRPEAFSVREHHLLLSVSRK